MLQSLADCCNTPVKGSLLWLGASQWRIYYHRMRVQLSTTCSNVLKQPNWELLVAVNHNQLRTMASETVDPIDWSQPPQSWAVPPERHMHSINQCNLSGTRTCNRSMRGNQLAYAATFLRGRKSLWLPVIIVPQFVIQSLAVTLLQYFCAWLPVIIVLQSVVQSLGYTELNVDRHYAICGTVLKLH